MKSTQGIRGVGVLRFFLFLALEAILFIGVERFSYFGRQPSKQDSCKV